jgi:hypothetical protein
MLLQQLLRPIHIDLGISLAHVNPIVVLRPIMAFQQFEDDFLAIMSVNLLLGFEYQLFMSKLLLLFHISLSLFMLSFVPGLLRVALLLLVFLLLSVFYFFGWFGGLVLLD